MDLCDLLILQMFDDSTGYITLETFATVLKNVMHIDDEYINKMFYDMDSTGSGKVEYGKSISCFVCVIQICSYIRFEKDFIYTVDSRLFEPRWVNKSGSNNRKFE